jgi:hypothetical protein
MKTRRSSAEWFIAQVLKLTYGELALVYFTTILVFAVLYDVLLVWDPSQAPTIPMSTPMNELLNSIYFSVVTATSVGFGDIVPQGISKILTGAESIFALFIFGVLVAKPISERQERAVYQMHQLTFDDIFNSIREGFYIMRKDFDIVIDEVSHTGTLTKRSAENLETALRHGQVLIDDIATFYDSERHLYRIDTRREKLLAEGVRRTFQRLELLLLDFKKASIKLSKGSSIHTPLIEFVTLAKAMVKRWQKHASKTVNDDLKVVEVSIKSIQRHI